MNTVTASPPFEQRAAGQGTPDAFHLAQAVCARVCHDIAGPLGALGGILDQALDGQDDEARGLAAELVAMLAARLRLLRCAWGGDDASGTAELHAMLPGLPGARNLRLNTEGLGDAAPDALRRTAPALLLLAATALPRGGLITLADEAAQDGCCMSLSIDGPGAGWPRPLAACAARTEPVAPTSPRGLAVPLACLAARDAGTILTIASPIRLTLHLA